MEINQVPSLKPLSHLCDCDVGMLFKVVEITDSVVAEEWAGH